ncbi:hypothetical protein T459_23965 [Capsicum annuum]|uniref:B box-type domain-containing protein n=1 Tax=Capsicum annuum TaxID=4072 RepID=A0A2G2YTU3_CAPAN|nr:hypothetical protein T459_23965 [Capsicum annuum]
MCKGRRESDEEKIEQHKIAPILSCELCKSVASIYCQADDAYLCRKCDKLVHAANFLAQRHIRCILCGYCKRLTQRYLIGISSEVSLIHGRIRRLSSDDENSCARIVKEPFLFL